MSAALPFLPVVLWTDRIVFLLAPNAGEPPRPVAKAAVLLRHLD